MDADGKNRKQLTTTETVDYDASVTTDGRYVVFTSERTGAPVSWVMNVDGSNQKKLEITGFNPQAGDGWVVYPDSQALWKAPIAGGEPVRLTEERLLRCGISHDGKMVACSLEAPGSPIRLAVLPIDGGTIKVFDVKFKLPARIRWMPDGRAVSYIGNQYGLADIWSQPLDGGEPKRLTNFKADSIFSFDWSRDNKLVISHGISASDVVLIRNVK
jgi:Tol biopolymer transport system component